MKHRIKKFVLWLIAVAALLANALLLLRGLSKKEGEDKVKRTQRVVFTGTALASILAIVALLLKRHREDDVHREALGHCPVCDVRLSGQGKYCSACGSRV
jgi:peptidoglycan biosynthesis protein MviN/MurJ (putative lipid II flippase)